MGTRLKSITLSHKLLLDKICLWNGGPTVYISNGVLACTFDIPLPAYILSTVSSPDHDHRAKVNRYDENLSSSAIKRSDLSPRSLLPYLKVTSPLSPGSVVKATSRQGRRRGPDIYKTIKVTSESRQEDILL